MSDRTELSGLLVQFHGELLDFLRRHAGRLLRYETEDDLIQEVHVRASSRETATATRGGSPSSRGSTRSRGASSPTGTRTGPRCAAARRGS